MGKMKEIKNGTRWLGKQPAAVIGLFLCLSVNAYAQTHVDRSGIWRWDASGKALALYGVNYTVPFAHSYRAHQRLGIDPKKSIYQDVYHFARLGLDAYRIHVWDGEITDSKGNLLDNEHLSLFDYLLMRLEERGMKVLLTPMIHFDNGYPDPPDAHGSFNEKYKTHEIFTHEQAIIAQETYLKQFLNHRNPYTKKRYQDDPSIVAIEILNEPSPKRQADQSYLTSYINRMVSAIRSTDCEKPIFFNVTRHVDFFPAIARADIQGFSFQWYPTGLVRQHELKGNLLYHVDQYAIPFKKNPLFQGKALMAYEFDAADVSTSFMYPAMARSFKSAGFQWATQFSYDSYATAPYNTEYHTHYLNLAYTPNKAIGMMIAAEAFRTLPLKKDFGTYPNNKAFGAFRIDEKTNLAEMRTEQQWLYTNTTESLPKDLKALTQVAGCGSSAVVAYDGTGAYFLDKVKAGVWRLEVMPDVFWVKDPFGRNNLDEKVALIQWRKQPMKVSLPDLGKNFKIKGVNHGNDEAAEAKNQTFSISPGTYYLYPVEEKQLPDPRQKLGNIRINEFAAPPDDVDGIYVKHTPVPRADEDTDILVSADIITPDGNPKEAYVQLGRDWKRLPMQHVHGYTFQAVISKALIKPGILHYHLVVKAGKRQKTFPARVKQRPSDWDFIAKASYSTRVVHPQTPVTLFSGAADSPRLIAPHWADGIAYHYAMKPTPATGEQALYLWADSLNQSRHTLTLSSHCADKVAARASSLSKKNTLVVTAASITDRGVPVHFGLVMKNGEMFSTVIPLTKALEAHTVPLSKLKPTPPVLLPRPYPEYGDYWRTTAGKHEFNMHDIEAIQISFGADLPKAAWHEKMGMIVEKIALQ